MDSLLQLAKRNVFANPFLSTASCEAKNEPSIPQPKAALLTPGPIPSRKIAFAATGNMQLQPLESLRLVDIHR